VKLIPGVNLPTFYKQLFSTFFHQKITKPNSKKRKVAQNSFVQKKAARKMLVKLTPKVMIGKGDREFVMENNDAKSRMEQMILIMEEKMKKSRYQTKMNGKCDL